VLTAIGDSSIRTLEEFTVVLSKLKPGEQVAPQAQAKGPKRVELLATGSGRVNRRHPRGPTLSVFPKLLAFSTLIA